MSKQLPYLAVLTAATLAGANGVFIKNIALPASSIAFIRMLIPILFFGTILALKGKPIFRQGYPVMLLASGINAARMYFFFTSFLYTSVANAVIMLYTWPIFTTLFSFFFLKEKVPARNFALLVLAFAGIVVVYMNQDISFENNDFIGMSSAVMHAALYASTVVIFKKHIGNYSSSEIIFFQNLLGMFVFMPFILINTPGPTFFQIGWASTYAALVGIGGFSLFFYGLKHIKASSASLLSYVEIVSALLFSIFVLHEEYSFNMLLGGSMIIASTALLKR